jgi:C-terminal processing protease CtpA/Prc
MPSLRTRRMIPCSLLILLGLSAWAPMTAGQDPTSANIDRLVSLAKVWSTVARSHPYLAYQPGIDWDAALLEAIPRVRAAHTAAEFERAIGSLLTVLADPASRVIRDPPQTHHDTAPPRAATHSLTDYGLVISTGDYAAPPDYPAVEAAMKRALEDLPKARALVLDLRSRSKLPPGWRGLSSVLLNGTGLAARLSSRAYSTPGQRTRIGFDFKVSTGHRVVPAPEAISVPVVFIVNANSDVPTEMLALQGEGLARVVAEGRVDESIAVSTTKLILADEVTVQVRLSELVFDDGVRPFTPDVVVDGSSSPPGKDEALAAAREALASRPPVRPRPTRVPARGITPMDTAMAEQLYPSADQRIFAVFRLWAAIDSRAPYRDLIGEDWDDVLRSFIPKVQQARGAREYHLAIAEMATHIHDSHALVRSTVLGEHFGTAAPPVRVRMIEGTPVIIGFRDEAAARAAGAAVGDVILEVDGEPVTERIRRYAAYVSASTPQALTRDVVDRRSTTAATGGVLFGQPESAATVEVRSASGEVKTLVLPRRTAFTSLLEQRSGEILRLLPGNIGYADLDRLRPEMVGEMFDRFKNTTAIIFDMRGYPRGLSQASVASRLTDRHSVAAAIFYTTVPAATSDPDADVETLATVETSQQRFQGAPKPYRGKTVMLIDERTQSAAEHLGLFLEMANGTTFIGSETAGANGNVTTIRLPGQISVSFSGLGVKHADGRQLQRVGLVPDVRVTPTLEGIRAGRDEVLEAAIEFLTQRR